MEQRGAEAKAGDRESGGGKTGGAKVDGSGATPNVCLEGCLVDISPAVTFARVPMTRGAGSYQRYHPHLAFD